MFAFFDLLSFVHLFSFEFFYGFLCSADDLSPPSVFISVFKYPVIVTSNKALLTYLFSSVYLSEGGKKCTHSSLKQKYRYR